MLAPGNIAQVAQAVGVIEQFEERHENQDFPTWLAMFAEPNGEEKSQKWLKRCKIYSYLPTFKKSYCRRGGMRYRRDCAVLPGLIFVPAVMSWIDGFRQKLEWARIRGVMKTGGGKPANLDIADIETIMRIEAKLNKPENPVDCRGIELQVGDRVRFLDVAKVRLFGEGTVFEVASDNRIGVEVSGLFCGKTKVFDHATEIEVM